MQIRVPEYHLMINLDKVIAVTKGVGLYSIDFYYTRDDSLTWEFESKERCDDVFNQIELLYKEL